MTRSITENTVGGSPNTRRLGKRADTGDGAPVCNGHGADVCEEDASLGSLAIAHDDDAADERPSEIAASLRTAILSKLLP